MAHLRVHRDNRNNRNLQVEMPLGTGSQPYPDQTPTRGDPRLEPPTAEPGSSVAAALTPYTWSKRQRESHDHTLYPLYFMYIVLV
ncbi:hypothetical protein CgunFtcFv8_011985 [Champsocephalus gunnari]|uniref:Uncharacterized protein n=1 Tax=Champsocephalus gunnari TaxID=52237 RepID=A0AAN8HM63_CHAGU|nr:hypothetical protein CgunFtcFv8_011985 [Champsocephalus gunnari]